MNAQMFLRRGAMISLFAGSAAVGLGAGLTYTWTNQVSGDWTNKANWITPGNPGTNGVPGKVDSAVFTNGSSFTVTISSNVNVVAVYNVMTNITVANGPTLTLAISPGVTFAPKDFQQGYSSSAGAITSFTNQTVVNGGGTFAPSGGVIVACAITAISTNTCSLTLSNVTFDTTSMNSLMVGCNTPNGGAVRGVFDGANASFVFNGAPNMLGATGSTVNAYASYNSGLNFGPTAAGGRGSAAVYLPGTITSVWVRGQIWLGAQAGATLLSTWDFGNGPQLASMTASNGFMLGAGYFTYTTNGAFVTNAFLPNVALTVGQPNQLAPLFFHNIQMLLPGPLNYTQWNTLNLNINDLRIVNNDTAGNGINGTAANVDFSERACMNLTGSSLSQTSLSCSNISVGGTINGNLGSMPDQGWQSATLTLPSALTNFWCSTLWLGAPILNPYVCTNIINFGTNTSHALVMRIDKTLRQGVGNFVYVSGTTTNIGAPPGSTLIVGSPTTLGNAWLGCIGTGTGGSANFGQGFTSVTFNVTNYVTGGHGTASSPHYFTNDYRGATYCSINATNAIYLSCAQGSWSNNMLITRSTVGDKHWYYFGPNARISTATFVVGFTNDAANHLSTTYLELSNTICSVSNSVLIDQTAAVTNFINGTSSGFDIGSTSLTISPSNTSWTAYGRMKLVFVSDPSDATKPYWGLRLKGNAVSVIQSLTNTSPVALSWSTNGLSPRVASRFGIQYDGNYTYVGVPPAVAGTSVFFR